MKITLLKSLKNVPTMGPKLFQEFTGFDLNSVESQYVSRYSKGGMYSGQVSSEFWLEEALYKRLNKLNLELG